MVERLARRLVAWGDANDSPQARAAGNFELGIALSNLNRIGEARSALNAAAELYEQLGDRLAAARTTMNLANIEIDHTVDVATARHLFETSLPVIRELGNPLTLAISLGNLGEIYRLEGDYRAALRVATEALDISRVHGDLSNIGWLLTDIAHYLLMLRRTGEAVESMHAAYTALQADPNPRWIAWFFDVWFLIAARTSCLDVAAQLLAFNDKLRDETNQPRPPAMLPWLSEPRERIARELGAELLDELIQAGEALTVETAQRLAVTAADRL